MRSSLPRVIWMNTCDVDELAFSTFSLASDRGVREQEWVCQVLDGKELITEIHFRCLEIALEVPISRKRRSRKQRTPRPKVLRTFTLSVTSIFPLDFGARSKARFEWIYIIAWQGVSNSTLEFEHMFKSLCSNKFGRAIRGLPIKHVRKIFGILDPLYIFWAKTLY